MECPICLEMILANVNCVTTDCGHSFHTSCLMKNTAVNGYDCPYCRTQMAESPEEEDDDDLDSDSDSDSEYDAEEEEDYILMGFRWFFQQVEGDELEGDADEYEEFQKEEREFNEENDQLSEEAKGKIENIMIGLKQINTISYEELLKAFIHISIDKLAVNREAEEAFEKVHSTINSISERSWV